MDIEIFLDNQTKFLWEVFKIGLPAQDTIKIPKTHPDFRWGVVMPQSLTIEQIICSYSDICPVWRWTNDNIDLITKSVRSADKGTYTTWFRDGVEPEEKYKNKSANHIQSDGINGSTLIERLLLGRWFTWMTDGQYLDVVNITRCDATRDFRGYVPAVYFDTRDGQLYIFRHDPEETDDSLRTREAISWEEK